MSDSDNALKKCILSSTSLPDAMKKMTPLSNAGHSKSMFLLGCATVCLSAKEEEWKRGYELITKSGDPRTKNFTWILPYAETVNSAYSQAFRNMCTMAIFDDEHFVRVRLNNELRET